MKGGYQIIDLKNVPFVTNGATMMIEGIYEVIEGNNFKPLLIENFVLDGVEKVGAYVVPKLNGSNFELDAYNKKIVITDTDAVSIVDNNDVTKVVIIGVDEDWNKYLYMFAHGTLPSNIKLFLPAVQTGDKLVYPCFLTNERIDAPVEYAFIISDVIGNDYPNYMTVQIDYAEQSWSIKIVPTYGG